MGSGCAGEGGVRCVCPGGCCVLVGLVVLVRGLRPVPPCFWSVGGGAVRAEGAGLCVVQERGAVAPHPSCNRSRMPARFEGRGRGLLFSAGAGFLSLGFVDKRHRACQRTTSVRVLVRGVFTARMSKIIGVGCLWVGCLPIRR